MDTYEYVTLNPSADRVLVIASELGIRKVAFGDFETVLEGYPDAARTSTEILEDAGWQISEYMQGTRKKLDVPLDIPSYPSYRYSVLQYLKTIPYGTTKTYAQVANATGKPSAIRAVGTACSTNPVPIIIPCHRVVRSNGDIGEYVGGRQFKASLLQLESSMN